MSRRRFYAIVVGYAVGASITLGAAQVMVSAFPMPTWWYSFLVGTVIVGFPISVAVKAT